MLATFAVRLDFGERGAQTCGWTAPALSYAPMILVLDNRDSFTFNLVQALWTLGHEVEVRRAESSSAEELLALRPERILVGPGPGKPEAARLSRELFEAARSTPILGVCLGHQVLAVACGARVGRSRVLAHGRTVEVDHDGLGVFAGLPPTIACTRYNSLTVEAASLPECLAVSASSADGEVMGVRHRSLPFEGVQFHPESVLSESGLELLENFARSSG